MPLPELIFSLRVSVLPWFVHPYLWGRQHKVTVVTVEMLEDRPRGGPRNALTPEAIDYWGIRRGKSRTGIIMQVPNHHGQKATFDIENSEDGHFTNKQLFARGVPVGLLVPIDSL